ncbi:uncharacterized [Tachysurus ichikawai]
MNKAFLGSHNTGAPQVLSADPNLSLSFYLISPSANEKVYRKREEGVSKCNPLVYRDGERVMELSDDIMQMVSRGELINDTTF